MLFKHEKDRFYSFWEWVLPLESAVLSKDCEPYRTLTEFFG